MARKVEGTRPMLALAARDIAAVSGVAETVVDVLHVKAMRHYAEGLRQYLAIRLGTVEDAKRVLGELRGVAAALGADELVRPPGIRARLYGLARAQALGSGDAKEGVSERRAKLPWRRAAGTSEAHASALDALRSKLSDEEAEMLELRYARELSPHEVAHVVGDELQELEGKLETAFAHASELVGATITSARGIESALLEAFALEARTDTVELESLELEPLPEGTVIGDRYEIEARVGSGSFSDVYRASDTEVPGHVVALKLLHQASLSEEAKDSALRELHLIASVFHPSIVQFKDHGWYERRLWFVMPWYEGEPLEARINREPLSRREARAIFQPLARALSTMHAVGIRHQDVKPDNILLANLEGFALDEDSGVLPVLIDLGVAAKEAEMVVAGTPTYFAPEVAAQFAQVDIQHPITTKADVFSLALALRNSLEPSTQDDVPAGAVEHFIQLRAQTMPDMPLSRDLRFLRPHFERWMSIDPGERPSAEELLDELAVLTRPEDRRERLKRLMRWLGPLSLAVIVAFASVVYILDQQARLQTFEAERARLEAADALADLSLESDRRRELEQDVTQLQQRYRTSKLSRAELAAKLGQTEGELGQATDLLSGEQRRTRTLRDRLGNAQEENTRLGGELTTTRGTLQTTRQDLDQTRVQLEGERQRATELGDTLSAVRDELARARTEAEQMRTRVAELDASLGTVRGQMAAEKARSEVLDRRLAAAESARTSAESRLDAAERRVVALEQEVARLRAAGGGTGGTVTGGGTVSGGGADTGGAEPTGG